MVAFHLLLRRHDIIRSATSSILRNRIIFEKYVRNVSVGSLTEASRLGGKKVTEMILRPNRDGTPNDLMCVNMMCEKVGQPCVCKLARYVSKLPNLTRLDISGNKIKIIPDALWELKALEYLNVSGNELNSLEGISQLDKLVTLIADDNNIAELDLTQNKKLTEFSMQRNNFVEVPDFSWETLSFPYLKIQLDGNPCYDELMQDASKFLEEDEEEGNDGSDDDEGDCYTDDDIEEIPLHKK